MKCLTVQPNLSFLFPAERRRTPDGRRVLERLPAGRGALQDARAQRRAVVARHLCRERERG